MQFHKGHRSFKAEAVFFSALMLCSLSACTTAAYQTQKTWIDQPFGTASYPAGEPFALIGHAFAEEGVAEIAIHIDGEPYTLLSPHEPGSEFSAFSSEVLIGDPGSHVISVVSFDTQGSPSEPVKIPVAITGAGEMITIQDTSEPLGTPMETLEIKRTEPPPAATATGTATIIKVPTSTTKPEDKQPPEIRNVSHTPQEIWNYHTCGAVEFDIRAQISDLSGIKKATVTLRVVKDGSTGEWVTANMNPFGDWYHATVGTDLLKASMDSYRGTVEYYLSAVDEMGNRAESPVRTLPVKDCLI